MKKIIIVSTIILLVVTIIILKNEFLDTDHHLQKQSTIILDGKIIYRTIEKYPEEGQTEISNYKMIDLNQIDSFEVINYHQFENENLKNYFKVEIDLQNIYNIGDFFGTPALSNNGKWIALNCGDDINQLCILHIEQKNFLFHKKYTFETINKIPLPSQCKSLLDQEYGLRSISWSPEDKELLIVCQNKIESPIDAQSAICLIDLKTKSSNCIDGDSISYAKWSPINNQVLLMDFKYKLKHPRIYLSNIENLNNKEFLFEGNMAQWSPDGQEIVYLQNFSKIYIFDINNKQSKKIYDMKDTTYGDGILIDETPYFSWSPNSKQIVFQSNIGGGANKNIVIYDFVNKDMIVLSEFEPHGVYSINPVWGK